MMNKKFISSLVFGIFFLASFTNIGSSKVAQAANLRLTGNETLINTINTSNNALLPLELRTPTNTYKSVLDSITGDWYNDAGDLIARINRDRIEIYRTRFGGNVLSASDFEGDWNDGDLIFGVSGGRTPTGANVGVLRVMIEWHINQPDGAKDYIIIDHGEVLH